MNRLERISAILVQLQSRTVVTAQHIATQYNVSLRTVYRDIKVLEEAGIPLIGNVGVGYSLIDGYKLSPLMFTREEAIAFLLAEKVVEKLTDLQNVQHFKAGMNKVRAVLRYVEKDYLTSLEDNISVLINRDEGSRFPIAITQTILKSIAEKKVMTIHYRGSQDELSERTIEPVGCFYSQVNWYLIAFCQLRNDYRNFRIDRIIDFTLIDRSFSRQHSTLCEYIDEFQEAEKLLEVVIRLRTEDLSKVTEYKYYQGWYKEEKKEDLTYLYFRVLDLEYFARWILGVADIVTIISPDSLKDKMISLLDNVSKKLKKEV